MYRQKRTFSYPIKVDMTPVFTLLLCLMLLQLVFMGLSLKEARELGELAPALSWSVEFITAELW